MYKSKINNDKELDIDLSKLNWDIIELKNNTYHIIDNYKSYNVSVLEADYDEKTFRIRVNSNNYDIKITDEFDMLAKKLGFANNAKKTVNNVKSPMSGVVLDIMVDVGSEIKKGDSVLILEAMKMENVIKSERDAIIKKININKGDSVQKNQILIDFE